MKTIDDTTFRILTIKEGEFESMFKEMDSHYWKIVQSTFDQTRHEFTVEFVRKGRFIDNLVKDIIDMIVGE